jgi:hypothetical protein
MELLATILRDLGFLFYGGPMVALAILIRVQGSIHQIPSSSLTRVFRAWGPGFGIALGSTVLGALLLRFIETGTFHWSVSSPFAVLDTLTWVLFLIMWISNIKLEIWTLEPLRQLDQEGRIGDKAAYEAAFLKLGRHLSVHGILVISVALLTVITRNI